MRIYIKIINEDHDPSLNNTNSNIKEFNHKEIEKKELLLLEGNGETLHYEDLNDIYLIKTLRYLFRNNFKIESNFLIDDLINVPDNCEITFELLEQLYNAWITCILDKRINENKLPYYLVNSIIGSSKDEWNSFLPILNELEKTHIFYCNIWIYIVKDYTTRTLTTKIEHFMDFQKKTNTTTSTINSNNNNNNFKLEDFNFFTLKQVKNCLIEDLPEKFKDLIEYYENFKEFKLIKK